MHSEVREMAQKVPVWAFKLTLRVCVECDRPMPRMTWHKGTASYSSGRTWLSTNGERPRVHLTAGTDTKDQRLVLLHELAHAMLPASEHHSDRFWKLAFLLYKRYGVPIRYATKREANYRKNSAFGVAAIRRIQSPWRTSVNASSGTTSPHAQHKLPSP
jgi:hypothetical protein